MVMIVGAWHWKGLDFNGDAGHRIAATEVIGNVETQWFGFPIHTTCDCCRRLIVFRLQRGRIGPQFSGGMDAKALGGEGDISFPYSIAISDDLVFIIRLTAKRQHRPPFAERATLCPASA